MTEVYLVRHGQAVWSTDEMRPLSAQGHCDAAAVADCLDGLRPQAIYSSPYSRARQTIEPLATRLGLPIHEVWDLRERQLRISADLATRSLAQPGAAASREIIPPNYAWDFVSERQMVR